MITKIFGDNLRRIILGGGVTLEEFANEHGICRRTLGRWIAGDNLPSTKTLTRLASILGVSEESLFVKDCPHS